jgi:hypothetical protein
MSGSAANGARAIGVEMAISAPRRPLALILPAGALN